MSKARLFSTRSHIPATAAFRARVHRGFTLVEVTLSMATMIVVLGGIGAAMALSARSVTTRNDSRTELRSGAEILAQLSDELRYATALNTAEADQIEFQVARGGSSQTIKYGWSGSDGDPLTKTIDDSSTAKVVATVSDFALTYQTTVPRQPAAEKERGEEEALATHDPVCNQNDFQVRSDEAVAHCWSLAFSDRTTKWSVSRVKFLARAKGEKNSTIRVEMRRATAMGTPTPQVLESFDLSEASLQDTYSWQEVSFSNVSDLSPEEKVCLVIGDAGSSGTGEGEDEGEDEGGHAGEIAFDNDCGQGFAMTSDGGLTWRKEDQKAVQHVLYGKVTKRTTPEPANEVVEQIRIKLTPSETDVPLHALVTTLNQPAFAKNP